MNRLPRLAGCSVRATLALSFFWRVRGQPYPYDFRGKRFLAFTRKGQAENIIPCGRKGEQDPITSRPPLDGEVAIRVKKERFLPPVEMTTKLQSGILKMPDGNVFRTGAGGDLV
ncbi:MAG: hypothetical protein JW902_04570 [Syntrophaceae bacterium]|nr:hypothetical protein [Syntrophaceae bacterium]